MDAKAIGARLARLRGSRTQEEVAKAVFVTPAAISMYEKGERIPRDEIKVALARYYKKTVESIFFADAVNR